MVARQMRGREPLVMSKVEVGLGAIVGDKDFTVLIGRHGAWINVQVGIALLEGDAKAAAFEQTAYRRRRNALAQGRNHAARDKDILRAGPQSARNPPEESAYDALWAETRRESNHDFKFQIFSQRSHIFR